MRQRLKVNTKPKIGFLWSVDLNNILPRAILMLHNVVQSAIHTTALIFAVSNVNFEAVLKI